MNNFGNHFHTFHGLCLLVHCGGGAYGDVYYCQDISGRRLAVKIVSKHKLGEQWERELRGVSNYRKITENSWRVYKFIIAALPRLIVFHQLGIFRFSCSKIASFRGYIILPCLRLYINCLRPGDRKERLQIWARQHRRIRSSGCGP